MTKIYSNSKDGKCMSDWMKDQLETHNITVHKFIGEGSYSKVFAAHSRDENCDVAVKVIHTGAKTDYVRKFLPRELEVVKRIQHDNIVKVLATAFFPNTTCMVIEYCENGDLLQRIKKLRRIPEGDAKFHFRQLIEALKYLQSNQIVHRDLKCENVFLDKFDNVKLGDFGFARYLKSGEASSTFCGSRIYVAPEVLKAQKYSGNTVDIWSCGIVLYIMTTGVMPYDDKDMKRMIEKQMAHKIRFPRVELSFELRRLVFDILHPYPANRPSYEKICESEWMKDTVYEMRSEDDCDTAADFTESPSDYRDMPRTEPIN